jgi:hypothetical protein
MEWRHTLVLLGALGACDGKDDPPPITIETDVDETAVEDTDEEETEPPPRDTGIGLVVTVEGQADILGGAAFLGHEVQALRIWNPNTDARTKARCVWTWDATSWANAPEQDGRADPLGSAADPATDRHAECPNCAFAFTVSFARRTQGDDLPWDTDVDTDPPLDTDGETRPLDCYSADLIDLEGAGIILPEERWEGYGYDPISDNDDNPNTGWLMLWDRMNRIWVPFVYEATVTEGQLAWSFDLWKYTY